MDLIAEKLNAIEWDYATKDLNALKELTKRIENKGRTLSLITYSELVNGVIFHFPNIKNGASYEIQTYDWSGLDRNIIGDYLGYITKCSYIENGFMASALVVNQLELKPSDVFFEWMKTLNVLPDSKEDTILTFWADQVNKAHNWYKYNRK